MKNAILKKIKAIKFDSPECDTVRPISLTKFSKKEYIDEGGSSIYWQRIKKFKREFQKKTGKNFVVGEKNLGKDTLWWDYGNIAVYHKNLLKLLDDSEEGRAVRDFYDFKECIVEKEKTQDLKIKNSILINSEVKGEVLNSIIVNSKIEKANLDNAVVINSKTKGVKGKNIILYYLDEEKRIRVLPDEVITDIVIGGGTKIRMRTSLLRDSKKDWKIRLPRNPFSYSEIERCLARLANNTFKLRA